MPKKSPRGKTAYVGPRKANVHLEIRARPSMTRTRKTKRRDDLVHLLRQVHHTEIRKVMELVVMTEMQKPHQNLLVKVRQERQTYYFVHT